MQKWYLVKGYAKNNRILKQMKIFAFSEESARILFISKHPVYHRYKVTLI